MSRVRLTMALIAIFKNNMIKDATDRRKIFLDEATVKLFQIDIDEFRSKGGQVSDDNEPIMTYFVFKST